MRLLVAAVVAVADLGAPIRRHLFAFLTESPYRWTERDDRMFAAYTRHPSNRDGAL